MHESGEEAWDRFVAGMCERKRRTQTGRDQKHEPGAHHITLT
jgi:hypothetical protein